VPATNPTPSLLWADGIIQQVDTVNRELWVLVANASLSFDVPPDCAVLLNAERVKLRLLQPADRAHVFYRADLRGLRTACRIEAQAGGVSSLSS
jgi:hypothetical protein